jgi:hypothetical protein
LRVRLLCGALLAAVLYAPVSDADNKHMGVGSCASSVCHGKLKPVTDKDPGGKSRVALNEYRRWLLEDRHSQAYSVLSSQLSKQIAANMGLASPTAAPLCLDCHADNVAKAQRGPSFRIEDGVGCEACHGGAEQWIKSHASNTVQHSANVAAGMYQTDQPNPRATLCLSCHLGTKDKFATHAIMGAGHPRLQFELETFVANQPAHYVVDKDYLERKGQISGMTLWLTGQLTAANDYVTLIRTPLFHATSLYPDFSFYDCDSCHHPMKDKRWTRQQVGEGVKSGSLRLQTQNLLILGIAAGVLDPPAAPELAAARADLVHAGQNDEAALNAACERTRKWIDAHRGWSSRQFSRDETAQVRKALLTSAAADSAFDFISAEQVVLSVQSLSYTLGDYAQRKAAFDLLFNAVKSESNFSAVQFAQAVRNAESKF